MTLTKDDIIKDEGKGLNDIIFFQNKARRELASKVADELAEINHLYLDSESPHFLCDGWLTTKIDDLIKTLRGEK